MTFTISTYCYEHERFVRDEIEAERSQAATRDKRIASEFAALNPATAPPDLPAAS